MRTTHSRFFAICSGRLKPVAAALGLLSVLALAPAALAQSGQVSFGNNYFVTGDYVVAGWAGKQPDANRAGFATGTITVPDAANQPNAASVPPGAQIVAAILYWTTVESSNSPGSGQNGFFKGYAISGTGLGNPNAPTSWSNGGCSGSSQGSKTMQVYRANVRPLLPVDAKGNILANNTYQVELPDNGSNGGGTPFTLGSSLVIIYRVLDPNVPLNSIVIYDGALAPSNSGSSMSLSMQGFYQAAASPVAKLTHIVANGQPNKFESVSLNNVNLPSLYGTLPPFPGIYNGDWDNPTWVVNNYGSVVNANDSSAITAVTPSASNSGCVSWGAVIVSTTVQDTDNDGLLDIWESSQGYTDVATGQAVALPGANLNQKDIFVQLDYMCSGTVDMAADFSGSTCDTSSGGVSLQPPAGAVTMMTNMFTLKGINLHLIPTYAVQEQTCTDNPSASPPVYCPYPGQAGVVAWKGGYEFVKNQPLNYSDETSCQQATNGPCIRRFQHGKKDSYHYALFGQALGAPNWSLMDGTLTGVQQAGNTVTFTTSTPHGLIVSSTDGHGRVTVGAAITNLNLNGTFLVTNVPNNTTFQIQIGGNATSSTYTQSTDPRLSVSSGVESTGSGFSDVGGADSLITLGLWGDPGKTNEVQAGTFTHELGHSLALTHGGYYFDGATGNYTPTIEANCKSNFQSVMNYLFQVDLLDDGLGNQVLDYSEQKLINLDEATLGGVTGLTASDGITATTYATTKWYTPNAPFGIGDAATRHCDGSPLLSTDLPMFRIEGATNPITPAWTNDQDINFDDKLNTGTPAVGTPGYLRGYPDWAHLDLRQIGASGSDVVGSGSWGLGAGSWGLGAGSWGFGAGSFGLGAGSWGFGAGSWGLGAGSWGFGAGSFGLGAGTGPEFTLEAAKSFVRPPRHLNAQIQSKPLGIQLTWLAPTFNQQVDHYNIYKGVDTAPGKPIYATVSGGTLSYFDPKVSCGHTYEYVVSAVQSGTLKESTPSNLVTIVSCSK